MTTGESAGRAVDDPRASATGSVLAYCARCERYAAVTDVRTDDIVGDGPAHVCEECRQAEDARTVREEPEPTASGERAEGSDRRASIVPHTGQSTDLIAAGPER